MSKRNIGSNFEDFLREEGQFEEASAVAIKRVIAYQLSELMKAHNISKTDMAARMGTSRSQLRRLLDPELPSVTLHTLTSAAEAIGGRLKIEYEYDVEIRTT